MFPDWLHLDNRLRGGVLFGQISREAGTVPSLSIDAACQHNACGCGGVLVRLAVERVQLSHGDTEYRRDCRDCGDLWIRPGAGLTGRGLSSLEEGIVCACEPGGVSDLLLRELLILTDRFDSAAKEACIGVRPCDLIHSSIASC